MTELTAPFMLKNDEKRIVYGPVLIPNEPDSDGDVVSAEKIEQVAHQFVEDYGNIDLMHSLNNVGKVIESYIAPVDLKVNNEMEIPKGSWIMGVRVTDDDSWESVKNGNLGGFSIMGISKTVMKSSEKNQAYKRTTLGDLGEDWIVNAVSLVTEPAVPKAKWIAVKSKATADDESKQTNKAQSGIAQETIEKALQGSIEHREELVRRKVYRTFDNHRSDSYVEATFNDYVIIKVIDELTDQRYLLRVTYEIDENGNVFFTSEPEQVTIQYSIVPNQQETIVRYSNDDDDKEESTQKSGFFDTIKRAFGFGSSEKSGRRFSEANYQRLLSIADTLEELLEEAEVERESVQRSKQKETEKEGGDDMNRDEVKGIVKEEMKSIDDKLNDLTQTIKNLGNDEYQEGRSQPEDKNEHNENIPEKKPKEEYIENEGQQTDPEQQHDQQDDPYVQGRNVENDVQNQDDDNTNDDETSEKGISEEDLQKALQAIKTKQPFSQRLAGQDGSVEKEKEDEPHRDAFGFKVKK